MANPLEKLVVVRTTAPYLSTSFLGRQEPSPLASLRGTKPARFAHLIPSAFDRSPQGGTNPVGVRGTGYRYGVPSPLASLRGTEGCRRDLIGLCEFARSGMPGVRVVRVGRRP